MTTHEPLTDTELEAMLARLTARGWSGGLEASIMAEVNATPQQHAWWSLRPSWSLSPRPELRLLAYVAIAGLLVALAVGTAIVASRLLDLRPRIPEVPSVLVPAGIETLSDAVTYETTVVDGEGVLWAAGRGTLVRYDPATGAGRTWTVDNGSRFAATSAGWPRITPARAGGVWLIGTQTLLRFDGTDFREILEVGSDIRTATEASDGTLWAGTVDGEIVHLSGSSRTRIAVPRSVDDAAISAIAVDDAGRVWCGWAEGGALSGGWVSRYDAGTWQTFGDVDAAPLGSAIRVIAPLPDGSVWVGTEWRSAADESGATRTTPGGLASFDGATWTDVGVGEPALQRITVTSVAADDDGSVWVVFYLPDGSIGVARRSADGWTSYGAADGLPGAEEANDALAWVLPTNQRVFIGTGAGIYERTDGQWSRVMPEAPPTGPDDWGPAHLAAVSRGEAWVATWDHVWHWVNDAWSQALTPQSTGNIRDLMRTPEGDVWVAADDGVYLWAGSAWTRVSDETAYGLGVDPDGLVWATGEEQVGVWHLRAYAHVDGAWTEQERLRPDLALLRNETGEIPFAVPGRIAFGDDGTIWAGSEGVWGWGGGLARSVGGAWERVNPRGDGELVITDLAVAPNGDVWVVGTDVTTVTTGNSSTTSDGESWIARFDGISWEIYEQAGNAGLPIGGSLLAVAPDGSIWVASGDGLARFDGTTWTTVRSEAAYEGVSVAPDGTIWVVGPSGVGRLTDTPVP